MKTNWTITKRANNDEVILMSLNAGIDFIIWSSFELDYCLDYRLSGSDKWNPYSRGIGYVNECMDIANTILSNPKLLEL